MSRSLRIGVDTGGTFTDLLASYPDGTLRAIKLASSTKSPADAVLAGLDQLLQVFEESRSIPPAAPEGAPRAYAPLSQRVAASADASVEIIHGTTVGTNAILERTGGPTAFVTTAGFEDLLILGRQTRPQLYALTPHVAPSLCADEHCVGVEERLGPDGAVITPLRDEALSALRDRVAALGVASIAVVLLHSYASDVHEKAVAAALLPLNLPISISSVVLPAHREYERAQATVADAYVAPIVGGYLTRLSEAVRTRAGARLRVMQSTGGAISAEEAVAVPVRTVLSGPAAGVVGAQAVAAASGVTRLISFDMGGTSTDVCLVGDDGEPMLTSEAQIAGLPLHLPMLAVHAVGAGGGSLARVDSGGVLQVGPASAGADPGPACYGRGGRIATLTDADLLLGRLSAARFCDGAVALSEPAAAAAVGAIAERLHLSVLEAAAGIIKVAGAVVARAIRAISVDRGHDPGDFTLVPFGGAGALHAADLAEELNITRILVPPAPGLLCAYGALCAKVVRERSRSLMCEASGAQADGSLRAALRGLSAQVQKDIEREGSLGRAARYEWSAELRYHGQSYELTLPGIGDGGPAMTAETDLVVRYHAEHQRRYGFTLGERRIDLVALRVRGVLPVQVTSPMQLARSHGKPASEARIGEVTMTFLLPTGPRSLPAPVLDRVALPTGHRLRGPALIVEYSATTVVPPGWGATVDEYGALLLHV